MSRATKEINKITGTIITIAIRVIVIAFLIAALMKGMTAAYNFGHSIFYEQGVEEAPGRDVQIVMPTDVTVSEAADILKNKGLIENKVSFNVQAKFFDLNVVPGTYTFNTSQSARQMLEALNEGPVEND